MGQDSADNASWGKLVTRIRLDCDANLRLQDFASAVVQKTGEPLDREKIRQTLKNLYATGRFQELRADTHPTEGGIELVLVARATFFVGVVRVEGAPDDINPSVLVTASRLRLGEPIETSKLDEGKQRLAAVLTENGYYRSQIVPNVRPEAETQVAEVVFSVDPGVPARLNKVEFRGNATVPSAKLASICGWRRKSHLNSSQLERGLFRLRRFYSARGRLQATATNVSRIQTDEGRSEDLVVQIDEGPLVRVKVVGTRVSKGKIKELLPFFREGTIDDTAVGRGGEILQNYFEQQGYYAVKVKTDYSVQQAPRQVDIIYSVELGQQGEFAGYQFEGNHHVPSKDLITVLSIHPRDFFRERGLFSREMLRRDKEALKALYEFRGYLEARVDSRVEYPSAHSIRSLSVTFIIDEGPRTVIHQLMMTGVDIDLRKDMWQSLLCKAGQPYSPSRAQIDREFILNYLADRGFARATANWKTAPASSDHQVDLQFEIEPGPQEKIQRIVIMGNEHTREGIIRRELDIHPDEPLRQSSVLESQRRLYDLGTFSQVQIAAQDPQVPETTKTVLVHVEEARRWTVGYGFGIDVGRLAGNEPQGQLKASPRLSLELTRLNVGGRAQSASLRGRLSTLDKGGAFSYLIPRFPTRRDLNLRISALGEKSQNILTFAAERVEASVAVEKQFSPAAYIQGRYTFRRVRVDESSLRIRPEEIPLVSRPARVAMLGLSYANDHRDEPTDATDGSYSLADAGVSWKQLGSQSNFVRFSGQNATYYRLTPHLTFARNTRFAVESTVGPVTATGEIPLPERFFMGGSESHRGFSVNQAGPRDPVTGFPIGGNALFLNSLELRSRFAGGRFGVVLFHDAGNVFSTIRRMRLLKFVQNSPTDLDYTSHVAGLGIRYRTPVGPVRFDVGYNFNPPRFQIIDKSVDPAGIAEVRRLAHIQFSLSIGQSF
ncbi:MAG: POTRA domain-containing protein [Terriglobia bacterium]